VKGVRVFRFRYSREAPPGPMIGYWNLTTGEEQFLHFPVNTHPRGFSWYAGKNFTKDDYLLEIALNEVVSNGFDILSVIGPMPMWRPTDEVSYQIIAQKREE